jgi:DNA-binding response OmpR family regulator/anti-sigma regulatory factor (Ser/Thr protein kinase)
MGITVLIVDDQPMNLELLEALLIPAGYTLISASGGEEALSRLSGAEPDLILLDVMMPGMSGLSVLKEIRNSERTSSIPVILLTALTDKEDRIKGIDAGADDYISKPFDKQELLSRVRTQTNLSVLRRQINEKEKLQGVMDLMFEGAAVTDGNFNVQRINNAALEMLGLKNTAVNLAVFLEDKQGHKLDAGSNRGKFMITMAENESNTALFLSVEYRRASKDGNSTGSYVFVFKDITEEYGRNKIKLDFLALISHKLRTPLTVITGYSRLLSIFSPGEKLKEMTGAITRNSLLIEDLIRRILKFVEIENAEKTGSDDALDLKEMADRFASQYRKQYELTAGTWPVNAKSWQKLAVEELVENAFKFNDKEKLLLDVRIDPEGLTVQDNGPGIHARERDRVFESFYQVQRDFSGNTGGLGLGLSIVKRLAESGNRVVKLEEPEAGGLRVVITRKKQSAAE